MKLRFLYKAYHLNKVIVQQHQMWFDFKLGTEIQGFFFQLSENTTKLVCSKTFVLTVLLEKIPMTHCSGLR